MKSFWAILLVLSVPMWANAVEVEPWGVGAGGRLGGASFGANSAETILIGSDMAGVHVSYDQGGRWQAINAGLPVETGAASSYVQDLLTFNYANKEHYYAATLGGIFRSTAGGDWDLETPAEDFHYYSGILDQLLPIHFSCLDQAGTFVVAGAGINRFHSTTGDYIYVNGESYYNDGYSLYASYPSLLDSDLDYSEPEGQWTVWLKYLSGPDAGTWMPYPLDTGEIGQNRFGAARDIKITEVGGVAYIIVAALDGVFAHDMTPGSPWIDLTAEDAYYLDDLGGYVNRGPLREMGPGMMPWNVHLTSGGTLYASMQRMGGQTGDPVAGGAYRLYDITDPEAGWYYAGNDTDVMPLLGHTLKSFGEADSSGEPLVQQVFMTVVEVDQLNEAQPVAGDVIYLCDAKDRRGIVRGFQPDQEAIACSWDALIFNKWPYGVLTNYSHNPTTEVTSLLDNGYQDWWATQVMFQPAAASDHAATLADINLLAQFSTRVHVTNDGGDTWIQSYANEPEPLDDDGPWRSRGFNELLVHNLDFASDGRLVFSCGDCGTFIESVEEPGFFDHAPITAANVVTWEGVVSMSNSTVDAAVVPDWNDSGKEAVFILAGQNSENNTKLTKVLMLHDGVLEHVSESLDVSTFNGGVANLELFQIVFRGDSVCFVSYRSRNSFWSYDCGVLKGVYNPDTGSWTWDSLDTGLPGDGQKWRVFRQLMVHEGTDRLFTVCNQGIYMLEPDEIDGWQRLYGDGTGESEFLDITSIAQSSDGSRIYAGTVGSTTRIATVLSCENPGAASEAMSWTPIVNTEGTDYPFTAPDLYFSPGTTGVGVHGTRVGAILVDPEYPERFYAAVSYGCFHPLQGLWSYNHSGCGNWECLTLDNSLTGVRIMDIALHSGYPDRLVLATNGMGVYTMDLSTYPTVACGHPGKKPNSRLALRSWSNDPNTAVFEFNLPGPSKAEFKIFDVRGRLVGRLDADSLQPGLQRVIWDCRGQGGQPVASGLYFVRMTTDAMSAVDRFVLVH